MSGYVNRQGLSLVGREAINCPKRLPATKRSLARPWWSREEHSAAARKQCGGGYSQKLSGLLPEGGGHRVYIIGGDRSEAEKPIREQFGRSSEQIIFSPPQ